MELLWELTLSTKPCYVCICDAGTLLYIFPSLPPPPPHSAGWIHLNKVWGNTNGGWGCCGDGGKASYWLVLVHPGHQLLPLLLKLIYLSGWVTRKYMDRGSEDAARSPPLWCKIWASRRGCFKIHQVLLVSSVRVLVRKASVNRNRTADRGTWHPANEQLPLVPLTPPCFVPIILCSGKFPCFAANSCC